MKKGWEKRFDEMWFAPPEETTLMNWSGLFRKQNWRNGDEDIETWLKRELALLVKNFIKGELK